MVVMVVVVLVIMVVMVVVVVMVLGMGPRTDNITVATRLVWNSNTL